MDFGAFQKELKKYKKPVCTCMFVKSDGNRCKNRPIGSHSLQKSVALRGIAHGGHVLALQPRFTPDDAEMVFNKVGFSKASVFPGYCKKHDSELFSEIEDGFTELSERSFCLITLRTLAREYFAKLAQIRLLNTEEFRKKMVGRTDKNFYDEFMVGCVLSREELKRLKQRLEKMLLNDSFEDLISREFVFDRPMPLAFAGSFSPQHSLKGKSIIPKFRAEWGVVFAFCGRVGTKNLFLVSSLSDQATEQISEFFKSMDECVSNPREFALNLSLEYIENLFFSPDWVDGLPPLLKARMARKFQAGLPGSEEHDPQGYFELETKI